MKKLLILSILLLGLGSLFAELEVDIPFDPNMIGPSFAANGEYQYDSDWITITNIGSTDETYDLTWSFADLPAGWTITVCNELGLCYIPNMAAPIDLATGESAEVHIEIGVYSAGGCSLNITLDGGDLTSPMSYDFTFDTQDNVSANQMLNTAELHACNYPNPFNPSTEIRFQTSDFRQIENVEIGIYNFKGQKVKTFESAQDNGDGFYSIIWNGNDDNNQPVASGVYYYQITSGSKKATGKMMLMK